MAAQPESTRMPFIGGFGDNLRDLAAIEKGEAYSSSLLLTTELQRLPYNPCRLVILSNWNSDISAVAPGYDALSADDLYENAGLEIYWGFRGVPAHQLFPTQMSPFLPINNTDQIVARVRAGSASRYLWFSWFV